MADSKGGSMSRHTQIDNSQDLLDVRDIIARFEELESDTARDDEDSEELSTLSALLEDLKGNGGDEDWRGCWYPITLIRDSYFRTYAEELAEDIGAINKDATWPLYHIDWEAAAKALQVDYSTVEFSGVTYWYR